MKDYRHAEERTFTPSEAAVISGASLQVVNKAIDEGPLETARNCKSRKRALTETDLLYLATASIFDPKLIQLTDQAKNRLRKAIAVWRQARRGGGQLTLFDGVGIEMRPVVAKVRARSLLLDRAKKMVVRSPHVRGGEPVIRGTRIGVYEVAAMADGASADEIEEILDGYPTLRREHLDLARIYAAAYPRRGRPPRHPWHRTGA